jgi:hypothetical protein
MTGFNSKRMMAREVDQSHLEALMLEVGTDSSGKWMDIDNVKKLAELIVRECVKFCEHESNDDEHDEYDMGMWVKAESIKAAIKQHFGVEE